MAIDYDRLMNREFPLVEQRVTPKDCILYALGLGFGADPMDERQLRFVYEDGLMALPMQAVVMAYPGMWAREPDTGLDWVKILHGEQEIVLHDTLPVDGVVSGRTRLTAIVDKGAGKGALLFSERTVTDAAGKPLATLRQTTFARGDGGFGGPSGPTPEPHRLPDRAPDAVCDIATLPQAALIYRLSGDYNPLHADPKVAKAAGFRAPILHGLGTLGVAGHAILKTCCDYDPARLRALKLRFSAPVYPGETIRTEMWRDGGVVSFRARVVERDAVVLNNGRAEVTA